MKIILRQHFLHPKDAINVKKKLIFKNTTQVGPLNRLICDTLRRKGSKRQNRGFAVEAKEVSARTYASFKWLYFQY